MKTKFFTLVYALFLLFAQNVHAECSSSHSNSTEDEFKTYLSPDQISFHDSKIFVQLNDDVFLVPAIFADQQGYYILNTKGQRCKNWEWKCPRSDCGVCNTYDHYHCQACGGEMN